MVLKPSHLATHPSRHRCCYGEGPHPNPALTTSVHPTSASLRFPTTGPVPLPHRPQVHEAAISKVKSVVTLLWPRAQVKAFGSYATGLMRPGDTSPALAPPRSTSRDLARSRSTSLGFARPRSISMDLAPSRVTSPDLDQTRVTSPWPRWTSRDLAPPRRAGSDIDLVVTLPPVRKTTAMPQVRPRVISLDLA